VSYWDEQARRFDEEPDHGLRDPETRLAWSTLLESFLPPGPATIGDVGCGTGSVSVLLSREDRRVVGLDFSAAMVAAATAKANRSDAPALFCIADASRPPWTEGRFDVIVVRHVLWAVDDADAAIEAWCRLLVPDGVLLLIEGHWGEVGITALEAEGIVRRHRGEAVVHRLDDPVLWGGPISDERYLIAIR